jgi:hypothetical protein
VSVDLVSASPFITHGLVEETDVFVSREHPGDASWSLTYARAFARPLAVCTLPVMIAALFTVLEGRDVMPYVLWGLPAAIMVASAWTVFRLKREIAESRVADGFAVVRTIWESSDPRQPAEWLPVYDVRDYGKWMLVTIGLTAFDLERSNWPRYDDLRDALRRANNA